MIAALCGFVEAWVLVAGPTYQRALELREAGLELRPIRSRPTAVPHPDPISAWWWLLPPVAYLKDRRRESAWRRQVMTNAKSTNFSNKAAEWFAVSTGAGLIGVEETGTSSNRSGGQVLAPSRSSRVARRRAVLPSTQDVHDTKVAVVRRSMMTAVLHFCDVHRGDSF